MNIPAWNALPLWLKIILFPMILSSALALAALAVWAITGLVIGVAAVVKHLSAPVTSAWHRFVQVFKKGKPVQIMPPSRHSEAS